MFDMVMPAFLRGLEGAPPCAAAPDDWSGTGTSLEAQRARERAVAGCAACPVAERCREYAIDRPYLKGIWGGSTHRERLQVRRERRQAAAA